MEISAFIASSGQPEEHQFKTIAQNNYKVVINLAMPNSDNAIPEEGNIVTELDMVYVHIPVPFDAPNTTHLTTFFKIMEIYSSEKVWVHCVLNYRVSAFLYLYRRLIKSDTVEQAKKVMLPSWKPNNVWTRFMEVSKEEL